MSFITLRHHSGTFLSGNLLIIIACVSIAFLAVPTNGNAQSSSIADESVGARVFPESTNVFLQIHQPDKLIDKIMKHQLRDDIEALAPVKEFLQSPQMKQGRLGLAFFETRIGEKWQPALKTLTDNGLFFGADLKEEAIGIAFHSSDEALLKKTAGELLGFIKGQQGDDAFSIENYRSGKFADLDNVLVARFEDWFIISNKKSYAQKMADNLLDGVMAGKDLSNTLTNNSVFQAAWNSFGKSDDISLFADLDFIRKAGVARELFAGSTDNAGAELLLGGVLEALKDADHFAAGLALDDEKISVNAKLPFRADSFNENREFFFGNKAMGRSPVLLEIPDLLAHVSTYRDLGRWWLSKEDLFSEKVIAELALADSQLTTFFGGADFGEDILGALQPGVQFLSKAQSYEEGVDPDIKLPAFAMVGRLQNPARETRFRISFNSFITLLNLSEEGNMPQFDVQTFNQKGYRITSAKYLKEDVAKGLIYTNFSPSIAFQDDYMIISSTEEFAHELAKATASSGNANTSSVNTEIQLGPEAIKEILQANRKSLIAQSMVDSGKQKERATAEVDFALSLLDFVKDASMDYRVDQDQMSLGIDLDFRDGN